MTTNEKFALITGATSGIGFELAKLFAADKYNLIIVARSEEELKKTAGELKQEFNIQVVSIAKDLFLKESPFEVFEEVQRRGISVDILVNNAGQGQYGKFIETDLNRELDIIQLNIVSYVVLTKLFLKEMVKRGEGKILNVSSIGSAIPGPLQAVYHATKSFITSFSEAIRAEIKENNITVTLLMPGVTDTDFFEKAEMEEAKMVKKGHLADPEKVAKDGYKALMAGDDKIISGLVNKAMVASSALLPDSAVAEMMRKGMEPSND